MKCRLAFMKWNEKDHLMLLPEVTFGLTNDLVLQRLVAMKQEMTRYLPSEKSVEIESILCCLKQWLGLFVLDSPTSEFDLIHAFFQGLCAQSHQSLMETDITYPMNLESHGLLHAYIVHYKFHDSLTLAYEELGSILKRYVFSNTKLFQQLCTKVQTFQKLFQDFQEVQVVTLENLPFVETQSILNPLQYYTFERMFFETKIDK